MDPIRISTMTQVGNISTAIDLQRLFQEISPSSRISYLGYGYDTKGTCVRTSRKVSPEKDTRRRYFFNQVTLHIVLDKVINMKIFNNGGVQMTGLKRESQGREAIHVLLREVRKLPAVSDVFLDTVDPAITMTKMVMINSDFDIGFEVERETLHREIIREGYYSSYESSIYPGVNIKYYYNPRQADGVCRCQGICDGKGNDGFCKKVTVAVFKSGKIIITGGQSMEHIHIAKDFITGFIKEREEILKIK